MRHGIRRVMAVAPSPQKLTLVSSLSMSIIPSLLDAVSV